MPERDLEARLDAVERALTDGETDLAGLEDAAGLAARLDRLEERIETLESSVDDLEAAVQAIRGYAGNIRAVNREVERRASAALAKAETIETAIDDGSDGRERAADHAGDPGQRERNDRRRQGQGQRQEWGEGQERGWGTQPRGNASDPGWSHAAEPATERRPPGGRSGIDDRDGRDPDVHSGSRASNGVDGVDGADQSRRTSQFIERVRDAL